LDVIVNHAFALPRIRTKRRQQSGAKSLLHSHYPALCCQHPEITVTIALGRKGTKKKQKVPRLYDKLLPALAVPAKQNHTVQEVQALLGIWHTARLLARSQNASKQAHRALGVALHSSLLDAVLCVPLLDGIMSLQLSEPLQKLLERWPLLWVAAHSKGNR